MSRYSEKCAFDAIQDKMAEYRDQQREAMRSACEDCEYHNGKCLYYDWAQELSQQRAKTWEIIKRANRKDA